MNRELQANPGTNWMLTAVALAVLAAGCSNKAAPTKHDATANSAAPTIREFTLFVSGEIKGQIEPCGCTTDPLGDLARTVAVVESARKHGPVLYVDTGSLLYTETKTPAGLEFQEDQKAALLLNTLTKRLRATAVGLGPYDLARGPGAVKPPRHAVNVPGDAGVPLSKPKVVDAGGVKVGVFGVVSPSAVESLGVAANDPIKAARLTVPALRGDGAELVIAIAHMTRAEAVAFARGVTGIDVVLIGQNLPEPDELSSAPSKIGNTWIIGPANRGQVITRFDFSIRAPVAGLADAIGPTRAKLIVETKQAELDALRANLVNWDSDPKADKAFVERKRGEVGELTQRIATLKSNPTQTPSAGSWFVLEQVAIRKSLPCNKHIVAAKQAYDKQVGETNLKAAAGVKPPQPAKGKPGYVGIEECDMCHADAVAFWNKTPHAKAWETLENAGKQWNRDCIGCHVTGWEKPGGSNLGFNEALRDLQCETCHGPGSIHVEEDGQDKPRTITRAPTQELCVRCHSQEHSDTFQFEAYLRDVTGPGHGEAFRSKLGDGDTGAALRAASLAKAGLKIGDNCPK